MRGSVCSLYALAALFAGSAVMPAGLMAQEATAPASQKPISQRQPSAEQVAETPVTDLNLKKTEIPPLLLAAEANPYGLAGIRSCDQIAAAVRKLDAVLGEDLDTTQARGHKVSVGKTAQSLVGGLIPFRGLVREASGAATQERRMNSAVYAGGVRRAFLKGVGLQKGCPYPAKPYGVKKIGG